MNRYLVYALALAAALIATAVAEAADNNLTGRERDAAMAACAQTHDTCLQSCNAAYPGGNVVGRGFNISCTNGCDQAYAACTKSLNLKATVNPNNGKNTNRPGSIAP